MGCSGGPFEKEEWVRMIFEDVSSEHMGVKEYICENVFENKSLNFFTYEVNKQHVLVVFHFIDHGNTDVFVSGCKKVHFEKLDCDSFHTVVELILNAIGSAKDSFADQPDLTGLKAVLTRLDQLIF